MKGVRRAKRSPATCLNAAGFGSKERRGLVDAVRDLLGLKPLYKTPVSGKPGTFDVRELPSRGAV